MRATDTTTPTSAPVPSVDPGRAQAPRTAAERVLLAGLLVLVAVMTVAIVVSAVGTVRA